MSEVTEVINIVVPEFGESVTEGIIRNPMQSGNIVVGQIICAIETDKISNDIEAEHNGTIEMLYNEGDTVPVGEVIAKITVGENIKNAYNSDNAQSKDINITQNSDEQNKIDGKTQHSKDLNGNNHHHASKSNTKIHTQGNTEINAKSNTQSMEKDLRNASQFTGEKIADNQSQKSLNGNLPEIHAQVAYTNNVPITSNEITRHENKIKDITVDKLMDIVAMESSSGEVVLSPSVSEILQKHNIDPVTLIGTGVSGRITEQDIEQRNKFELLDDPQNLRNTPNIKNFAIAKQSVAHNISNAVVNKVPVTTFNEINFSNILQILKTNKISIVSFMMRVVSVALAQYPICVSYVEDGKQHFNSTDAIGFAMAMDDGSVITPTIFNCSERSIRNINSELRDISHMVKEKKYDFDLSGGSIIISNGGVYGSMLSTPVIPSVKHSGIIGIHNIQKRPVVVDNQIVIADMMYVAFTYDHLVIDGRTAVEFLKRIKSIIENHELLF